MSEQQDFPSLRVRPVFELEFDSPPEKLMHDLRQRLPDCPSCVGTSVGRHAELFVPEEERRVWSPWLSVSAERREGGCVLQGRFAPHPQVWTFYMFLAFAAGFALLVGLSWGYAQFVLDMTPWALLSVPVVALTGIALWLASRAGQRLGNNQMLHLRHALEEMIGAETTHTSPASSSSTTSH